MNFKDWSDPDVARVWSASADKHTPTRPEHLDILLALLEDHFQPGKTILDLGYGSGMVEALIFQRIPTAQIVGIDNSPAMMAMAVERLKPYPFRFIPVEYNLAKLSDLVKPGSPLPKQQYQIAISVQAMHHLTPPETQAAYLALYEILEPDGLFFLVDRVAINTPGLFEVYKTVWRRLDKLTGGEQAPFEGDTYEKHLELLHERADLPLPLEDHLNWLRVAGFEAAPLHMHAHRAIIVGRRLSG